VVLVALTLNTHDHLKGREKHKRTNAHPVTRLHMQEELNPQQHRCKNLKAGNTLFHIPTIFPSSCFTSPLYSPPAVSHPRCIPLQLFHIPAVFPSSCFTSPLYSPPAVSHPHCIPLQLFHIPAIFPSSCFTSPLYSPPAVSHPHSILLPLFHIPTLFPSSCFTSPLYSPPVTEVTLHCRKLFTTTSFHNVDSVWQNVKLFI